VSLAQRHPDRAGEEAATEADPRITDTSAEAGSVMTPMSSPFYGRRVWLGHDVDCPFHVDQYAFECDCHHGLWFWAW
jgi:hypothetical protein